MNMVKHKKFDCARRNRKIRIIIRKTEIFEKCPMFFVKRHGPGSYCGILQGGCGREPITGVDTE